MHEPFQASLRTHVCTGLLCALFLALWATHVAAQVDKGMIVGTVCDPTGAAVPDARVVVTNLATLVTQAAATNSDGQYVLLLIQVGTYSLDSAEFVASITQPFPLNPNEYRSACIGPGFSSVWGPIWKMRKILGWPHGERLRQPVLMVEGSDSWFGASF